MYSVSTSCDFSATTKNTSENDDQTQYQMWEHPTDHPCHWLDFGSRGGGMLASIQSFPETSAISSGSSSDVETDYYSQLHVYPFDVTYYHSGVAYSTGASLGSPVFPLSDLIIGGNELVALCNSSYIEKSQMLRVIFVQPGAVVEIGQPSGDDYMTFSGSTDEAGDVYTVEYHQVEGQGFYSGNVTLLVVEPMGNSPENPISGEFPPSDCSPSLYDGAYIAIGTEIEIGTGGSIITPTDPGLEFVREGSNTYLRGTLTQPGQLVINSLRLTLNVVSDYPELKFKSDPLEGTIVFNRV